MTVHDLPGTGRGPPLPFEAHMSHAGDDVLFEYDVTDDRKRYLINTTSASAPPLTVVLNWSKQ